ncbi:MAG: 5-formyltetrahydrofolate cyclo-ligase [Thermoplasmatales archaeon]|nr:5-formyltetrahydrofolate cyclo-ligase [Thermoplasmatales archaeon]
MKEKIRKELLEKRNSLTTYEILEKSNLILKNLYSLEEFSKASKLASYISFGSEVYTHGLIREYSKKKEFFVPFIKDGDIFLSRISSWEELEGGIYGILQPKEPKVENGNLDIIIVPGIAFDENGNRIGYGKGYFDRLLKKFSSIKVALAFDFQVLKNIPNQEHDVKMDIIVTEKRIINCNVR